MLTCTICKHKQRGAIERELVGRRPLREVAVRYGVSKSALDRHRGHLSAEVIATQKSQDVERVDSVLGDVRAGIERMKGLVARVEAILERSDQDPTLALRAIRELANVNKEERSGHELLAKLTGQLGSAPVLPGAQVVIVVPGSDAPGGVRDRPEPRAAVIDISPTE